MWQSLFWRKNVQLLLGDQQQADSLRRELSTLDVTLLGIGAIIGAGIFATIGTAALGDSLRPGAGPSLMLSFGITAIVCGFTALCYAELAATVPIAGSAYTYTYASFGELLAWIIGWDLMLEYAISNVAVAISWANYMRAFLHGIGIHVPLWLAIDYKTAAQIPGFLATVPHVLGVPIVCNLLASSITVGLTVLLVWGIRESARLNAVMVALKILVLLLFVGTIFAVVPTQTIETHWQPFFPNGLSGTFAGAAIVFFAYIGFDTVSTVAEETKDPGKTLPRAILASLLICTLLYVLVAGAFTGAMSQDEMARQAIAIQGEPLAAILHHVLPASPWLTTLVALGAVLAQTVTLLVYQLGQPRIFFAMARDGLLPPCFAAVHPRYKTPHITTWLTGAMVALASLGLNMESLIDLTNIGTLFAFMLVCIGIPLLRWLEPERERPFRVPGGALPIPLLGALSCLALMAYLPQTSWWRFAGWLLAGVVLYVLYGVQHSRLGNIQGRKVPHLAWRLLFSIILVTLAWWMWHRHGMGTLPHPT